MCSLTPQKGNVKHSNALLYTCTKLGGIFMFYDSFINLCEIRGVSPTRVLVELNLSKGSLSRWRNGGQPRNEIKKKIADYFDITVYELLNDTKKARPQKSEDELLNEELIRLLRNLEPNQVQRVRDFVQGIIASR